MTPDEARTALAAARSAQLLSTWEEVRTLLQPVVDAEVLTGDEGAEASYLMGEYCRITNSLDAAYSYYEYAKQYNSSSWSRKCDERLAELHRRDDAIDAGADGVVQDEAATVLASADDLEGHGRYDEALPMYVSVYQGVVNGDPKLRAALGIAKCKAYSHQYDEGIDYATYVDNEASGSLKTSAGELLAWIRQQQSATAALDGGVAAHEYRQVLRAGVQAHSMGDFHEAIRLNEAVWRSEQVPGVDRANASWNLAINHLALDDIPAATTHLQYVVDHGTGPALNAARRVQSELHSIEAAKAAAVAAGPLEAQS